MQVCRICKIEKSFEDFYKHPGFKTTGRDTRCKECSKIYARNYEKTNRDKRNAQKRKYRSQSYVKEQRAKYYREHRAKQGPEYFKNERETCKAWLKQSGMSPIYNERRRLRKAMLDGNYTLKDRKITFVAFGNQCFRCHATTNLQIDHHYPLDLGYGLAIDNAVLLCKSCNSSKRNQLPQDFYTQEQLDNIEWVLAMIETS